MTTQEPNSGELRPSPPESAAPEAEPTPELVPRTRRLRPGPIALGPWISWPLAVLALMGAIACWFAPYVFWEANIYVDRLWAGIFFVVAMLSLTSGLWGGRISRGPGLTAALWLGLALVLVGMGWTSAHHVALARQIEPKATPSPARGAEDGRLDFVLVGDMGKPNRHTEAIIARAGELDRANPLQAFFMLGDNMQGEGRFEPNLEERFTVPFRPLTERGVPFYFALGNHDHDAGFDDDQMAYPAFNMNGHNYYRADFGQGLVSFFALDTEKLLFDPKQLLWLKRSLVQSTSQWNIVVMHKPLTFVPEDHGLRPMLSRRIDRLMQGPGKPDLIISGHNHTYERFRLDSGVLHLTVGNTSKTNERAKPLKPNMLFFENSRRGMLHLSITPERIEGRALYTSGEVMDQFAIDSPDLTLAHPRP